MREIDLPVFPSNTPLSSAMATMHALGRSAAVTLSGGKLKLIGARNIVIAASTGKETLDRIGGAQVVVTERSPLARGQSWTMTKAVQLSTASLEIPIGHTSYTRSFGSCLRNKRASRAESRFRLPLVGILRFCITPTTDRSSRPRKQKGGL